MIDLDDVEDGDTLVIEAEVVRSAGGNIWVKSDWIRLNGQKSKVNEVVGHRPKPRITEPTGLGAVVEGTWEFGNHYQWIRVSIDGDMPWQTVSYPSTQYDFDSLLSHCEDLQVLSEGI